MKNLYLFILSIFLCYASAKADDKPGLLINGGYKTSKIFYSGFKNLVTSYNATNPGNKTPLKNFGPASGSWYCVGGTMGGAYIAYYHENISATAESKVSDVYSRNFKLTHKLWGADVGGGTTSENNSFVVFVGTYFAVADISAYFKYFDGYKSYGAESPRNGKYHGFALSGAVGAKYMRFFEFVGLSAAVRWHFIGGTKIGYNDFLGSRSNTLSSDWGGGGDPLLPKFNALSLELGLAFRLSE